MKKTYLCPVTEVVSLRLERQVLTISGDNENYGTGDSLGEDED